MSDEFQALRQERIQFGKLSSFDDGVYNDNDRSSYLSCVPEDEEEKHSTDRFESTRARTKEMSKIYSHEIMDMDENLIENERKSRIIDRETEVSYSNIWEWTNI